MSLKSKMLEEGISKNLTAMQAKIDHLQSLLNIDGLAQSEIEYLEVALSINNSMRSSMHAAWTMILGTYLPKS